VRELVCLAHGTSPEIGRSASGWVSVMSGARTAPRPGPSRVLTTLGEGSQPVVRASRGRGPCVHPGRHEQEEAARSRGAPRGLWRASTGRSGVLLRRAAHGATCRKNGEELLGPAGAVVLS